MLNGPQAVEPGSETAAVIAQEEKILSSVLQRLLEHLSDRAATFSKNQTSVYERARENLLELRDLLNEARPFDIPALTEQMHHLSALANVVDPRLTVPADPQNPYFAHIRVREGQKERDVLIGKRSFVDAKNEINIVDWRNAPISQIYYTCDEGGDYDIQYGGRDVEGQMLIRRAITIIKGRLRRLHTPRLDLIYHDDKNTWLVQVKSPAPILQGGQGSAKRVPHAKPRFGTGDDVGYRIDKHLPEIAALIDPQQFEMITQTEAGLVILQGGAGSGKTTVALHRVAFLNYQNPERFGGDKILIAVFSRALANYISQVLPSLDVHDVKVLTYRQWTHKLRRQLLPHLPSKENVDIPVAAERLKKHPAMLHILKNYVADQTTSLTSEFQSRFNEEFQKVWNKHASARLVPRLQKTLEALQRQGPSVPEEMALNKALERAKDLYADWAEILTDMSRLKKGLQEYGDDTFSDRQLDEVVRYCSRQTIDLSEDAAETMAEQESNDTRGALDALDNTLLVRLSQMKFGGLITPSGKEIFYEHSVIDEAQDLSPLEVQVVIDATANESVTLAGDTAQKLIFDNGFSSWQDLLRDIGKEAIHLEPLRIGYRSTHDINLFARAILGSLAPVEPVLSKRSGVPVEFFSFLETGQAVAFLIDALRGLMERERQANVALLTLLPEQADFFYEHLQKAQLAPIRRIRQQEFSFTPGIDLTDISQIKGLEYDYVIILEANNENFPATDEARHLLHIAATRAAHQLWLISSGRPSPLIPKEYLREI